jgi:2',3'-cyclic-nucleotide 2'-phosphodiesterase/3'-nucleotidase
MEDLGYSLDTHRLVVDRLKAPRFSANLQFDDNGKLVYPPYRIFTVPVPGKAPLRIGLLGLLDSGYDLFAFGPDGRSVVAAPMREALDKYLPELRSKSDVVILMAETRPESL